MAKKLPSYEDILNLPEGVKGEIIAGQLYTAPRPAGRHLAAANRISTRISGAFEPGGPIGGWIILPEPEIHLSGQIFVPDLCGWRIDQLPSDPADCLAEAFITVKPDWICEVTSPSSGDYDRKTKAQIYVWLGIPYYWIVDPQKRQIQAFALDPEKGRWSGGSTYDGTSKARIPPFEGLELDLSAIWLGK